MADREREPNICHVTDPSCSYGLQAAWGFGNQLFLFPGKKANLLPNDRGQVSRQNIYEARWDIDLYHPVLRKLVNESHNVFVHVQKMAKETSGATLHSHIVKASRHYRSLLMTYSNELRLLGESTIDEDQKQQHENALKLLEMSELIWGLCEILFIDIGNQTGGLVITQLLDWLRLHDGYGDLLYSEVIEEEAPDLHPDYWNAIYRLVLQGQVDKVRKLLSCHSARRNKDSFTSMDELLKKMPMYNNLYRDYSVAEFDMKWRHWKDECERRLEQNEFSLNKNLEDLARILCGDEAIFKELSDCCGSWYFMMVSKMLYQNPTVKSIDLQYCVQSCMDAYRNSTSPMGELDNILLSAVEFDIHQVIKDSFAMFTNNWFVTHLADLLHHCGQLEAHKLQFGSSLREFLLLEYASSLMSHKSLWIIGVNYLDNCPEFGRKYLEHFIGNMAIETERKAQKLLSICEERGMKEESRSICKVIGRRHMQNKRFGSALTWFLRSKDVAFATVVAEKFLLEYSESGCFSDLDLLDNLGPSMLLSNTLIFLSKYREFRKLFEDGEFHAAGALLLSLIKARLAPKQFWITLLIDALPLLEANELIFNSADTYELMHCLEELTREDQITKRKENRPQVLSKEDDERLGLLRLGLNRNLQRAIIEEGTVKLT